MPGHAESNASKLCLFFYYPSLCNLYADMTLISDVEKPRIFPLTLTLNFYRTLPYYLTWNIDIIAVYLLTAACHFIACLFIYL